MTEANINHLIDVAAQVVVVLSFFALLVFLWVAHDITKDPIDGDDVEGWFVGNPDRDIERNTPNGQLRAGRAERRRRVEESSHE